MERTRGGSRTALRVVASYLLEDGERHVANVGAYRLREGDAPDHAEGFLSNRWLWPAAWAGWSEAERAAIAEAGERFAPDWELPAGEFSAWHWMVLRGGELEGSYAYEAPVVVLMDTDCFSATDIFLGGLAGLDAVTLAGTVSGGGSGRSERHALAHSRIPLRMSTMASFRPDGRRYDGLGVEPDVELLPAPGDFTDAGDTQLERALALLRPR